MLAEQGAFALEVVRPPRPQHPPGRREVELGRVDDAGEDGPVGPGQERGRATGARWSGRVGRPGASSASATSSTQVQRPASGCSDQPGRARRSSGVPVRRAGEGRVRRDGRRRRGAWRRPRRRRDVPRETSASPSTPPKPPTRTRPDRQRRAGHPAGEGGQHVDAVGDEERRRGPGPRPSRPGARTVTAPCPEIRPLDGPRRTAAHAQARGRRAIERSKSRADRSTNRRSDRPRRARLSSDVARESRTARVARRRPRRAGRRRGCRGPRRGPS